MVEKIYDASPIWIQNLIVAAAGYKKYFSRYGKTYHDYKNFLKEFDSWPLQKKLDFQKDELVKFIRFTCNNSPYYKELYSGIDINIIQTTDDLKKLPVITKEMLRENISNIDTTGGKGLKGSTGGTTGKSLTVYYNLENTMQRMAMLDHFKERTGFVHLKMRRATFNGKHIVPPTQKSKVFWRYNPSCKQMIYSSFHISEENIKYYVESLNKFKPDAIDGFFMCIVDIASYVERHNVPLTFTPKGIFPTSETLTAEGRVLIERVFKCKVYDQYASSEGAPFITECINQVPHVELASGVFENFSEDDDEVLVTSFTTYGTPLVRYRIGDKVKFKKEMTCTCGLNSPEVIEIQGRKLDFLYTPDGAKINGGNVSNIFKNMPNIIIRAQLIQDRLDEIVMNIEVDKANFRQEHIDDIRTEFKHKFGEGSHLVVNVVDSIPRESSGKLRLIKNNVNL
ncbi:MAG: phenylacetate--CoA ligase family protein [Flavobacterium sp.]